MSKHSLLFSIMLLVSFTAISQISFSNQTPTLLSDQTVYSGCAMGIADMNGDTLDDIIRLSNARVLNIEYQQADGSTFGNYNYGTLSGSQWSMCIADVDGNGYNDILTGGAYNNLKLLVANNSGDDYALTTISNPSIFLQGSNFADIDNNGTTDIFACHDDGLSAPFSNDGAGNFTHDIGLIDASSTVPSDNSGNYGSVWTDYDNDGDLDMYLSKCRLGVSNPMDGRRINMLFQNDGNNNYTDVAEAAGLRPLAQSWAADFADIDNDGDLDCFIANHDMVSQIYKNNGDGTFTDITSTSGMSADLAAVPSGIQCIFDDFDNDGFVDLLYTSLNGAHRLFKNNGDLTFTTVGNPFPDNGWGIQSAVTGDLNNDGYIDVYAGFASGYNGPNSSRDDLLFINDETGNNYLKLLLKGDVGTNINAIGARTEIYGDWGVQVREVRSGESYGIMTSMVLHYGIGTATEIDSIKIRWPNGNEEIMVAPEINQTLVLTENNLPAGPLPLDLLSFTAVQFEKDKVELQWLSENETNVSHFEIERSPNFSDFKTIGDVPAQNNFDQNQYKWIDLAPEMGNNYYRLRLVDIDGSYRYSDWKNIKLFSNQNDLQVYPNPANDKLFITLGHTPAQSFSIYNTTGSLVLEKQNVSGDFEINLSGWESGIYILQMKTIGESRFIRFSKM